MTDGNDDSRNDVNAVSPKESFQCGPHAAAQAMALIIWAGHFLALEPGGAGWLYNTTPMFFFSVIFSFIPVVLIGAPVGLFYGFASGSRHDGWRYVSLTVLLIFGAYAVIAANTMISLSCMFGGGCDIHPLGWLGNLIGMELGLLLELLIGRWIYSSIGEKRSWFLSRDYRYRTVIAALPEGDYHPLPLS